MSEPLPEWFTELVRAATAADGQPPFSDQSLVDLTSGARMLTGVEPSEGGRPIAAAAHSATELELVVAPEHRREGHGARLAARVLSDHPSIVLAWAHGDHPGSRILAARFGFEPVRTLLQLRTLELKAEAISGLRRDASAGGRLDPRFHDLHLESFRPGVDDAAWLDLNARAFAEHPEQGALTQRDLDSRKAEAWFDPESFLLLFDGDELVGSNWLKIDPSQPTIGEIYAISVAPEHQGRGHSGTLMDAGLARLRERGATTASLYVEADNHPALALYERYGFARHTIDVQYSHA